MRIWKTIACLALLMIPLSAHAGEKAKVQVQIDASRAAIEAFTKRTDGNKLVTADIEAANGALKKGEEALAAGSSMFGNVSPEATLDVKYSGEMVDLYLALGQSRLDSARAADELAILKAQVAKLKGKVKVFDDRKAEMENLKASLAKFDAALKELGDAKADNSRLAEKAAGLEQEKKSLGSEIERLKSELAKRDAALAANAANAANGANGAAAVPPTPVQEPVKH